MMQQHTCSNLVLFFIILTILLASCADSSAVVSPAMSQENVGVPTETQALSPQPADSSLSFSPVMKMIDPVIVTKDLAYAQLGPFTAGVQTFQLNEKVSLTGYIYYPIHATKEPDLSNAPYPLVIFASGYSTSPAQYNYLLSHLASYGFAVMTWTPRGEVGDNTSEISMTAPLAYRPQDWKLLVEKLETASAPGGALAGLIDTSRIAFGGHSMGGGTALSAGGAPIEFGWCAAHAGLLNKDEELTCLEFNKHQEKIASLLGLPSVPDGKWPAVDDPRTAAVFPLSPMGKLWGAEYDSLAAVKIPALVMTGSDDNILSPETCAYPIYEYLGSAQKALVVIEKADHLVFWETSTAANHDLINHTITAFLLAVVNKDADAARALSPENMKRPGVRYEGGNFQ